MNNESDFKLNIASDSGAKREIIFDKSGNNLIVTQIHIYLSNSRMDREYICVDYKSKTVSLSADSFRNAVEDRLSRPLFSRVYKYSMSSLNITQIEQAIKTIETWATKNLKIVQQDNDRDNHRRR